MQQDAPWHLLRDIALMGLSAGVLCAVMIVGLMPALVRYALARPNARSSHTVPTPQGGGIAVVTATLVVAVLTVLFLLEPDSAMRWQFWVLCGAVVALAIVGCIDDLSTIEVLPRLALQAVAVIAVVAALPADLQVTGLPPWIERIGAVVAGVWFVNLVNFMDGVDWMTVIEVVAITCGISLIALVVELPSTCLLVAFTLLGATLGFAPFNRPVARLFLGDVGSLPVGLLLFWLLLQLAGNGYLCAALLLPLYYLADATITLLRRLAKGEKITQAHRSHFYQRATERGLTVPGVIARVALTNVWLVILALVSVWKNILTVDLVVLVVGAVSVAALLLSLSRGRP